MILNDQYNFSHIVLLNIIFILIMAFYYILSNLKEDSLPVDFIRRTALRYLVIITCFLFSLVSIFAILRSLMKRSEALHIDKPSIMLVDGREKIRSENKNIAIEKKFIGSQSFGVRSVAYEKTSMNVETDTFKYFNILILIYVIFLSVSYFIHKKN
jgi:hypothetical protein